MVTLNNITPPNNFYYFNISKITLSDYMFFIFLTRTSSFILIRCHLLFDLKVYNLCQILNLKTYELNI